MTKSSSFRLLAIVLTALGLLLSLQGCAYLKYRADDFAEIVDIGFTISKKPYFALYADDYRFCHLGMPMWMGTSSGGAAVRWGRPRTLCIPGVCWFMAQRNWAGTASMRVRVERKKRRRTRPGVRGRVHRTRRWRNDGN